MKNSPTGGNFHLFLSISATHAIETAFLRTKIVSVYDISYKYTFLVNECPILKNALDTVSNERVL